jgi:hypothetical protein
VYLQSKISIALCYLKNKWSLKTDQQKYWKELATLVHACNPSSARGRGRKMGSSSQVGAKVAVQSCPQNKIRTKGMGALVE